MNKGKRIKYIGYYDIQKNKDKNRYSKLSATNKMDYIIKTLNRNGYDVDIISPSYARNNKYCKGEKVSLIQHNRLILFPSLAWSDEMNIAGKVKRKSAYIFNRVTIFIYLLFTIRKNEEVLVYHSLYLMNIIKLLKSLKSFSLILEINEIYQDVVDTTKKMQQYEYEFFNMAHKYIFSTELLNEKINCIKKPYVINHGTYQVEENRNAKFDDNKIHVVYSGTFDPRKGGAIAAAAAEFLPENYHVHIIGSGTKEDEDNLLKEIGRVLQIAKANISYDGLLSGEEYILFLQKCHIGLGTQNPNAEFNDTSFPSKILSYMANGLKVVSANIKAVKNSYVGRYLVLYDKQTSKEIANAIIKCSKANITDTRMIVSQLDEIFTHEIKYLLNTRRV
jgi:glycosyltransferase involved in cell wall biosynthesis